MFLYIYINALKILLELKDEIIIIIIIRKKGVKLVKIFLILCK